jgi:carbon storage regulator CsrA
MKTFSCKKYESIVVGDGIIVTVLDIQGPHVELSIEYPSGTSIRRKEVLELVGQSVGLWGEEN